MIWKVSWMFDHVVLSVCTCMHMFMYMCKFVWKCMFTCVWRPKVNLRCLPLCQCTWLFLRQGLSLSMGHTCLSRLVDQQTPGTLLALSFQCLYYVCILQHVALKLGAEELSSSPPMLSLQASRPLSLLSCLPVAFGTWFLSSHLPAQAKLATRTSLLLFHVLKDKEGVNRTP